MFPRIIVIFGLTLATAASQATFPQYDQSLQLETTSETSANISFGDLNADGHLDIVLAKGRHWPLVDRVLLGDGKGGIREAYDLGAASDRTYTAALADLDGNGSLDVVISNDAPDPKIVYLNDGQGRFRRGSSFGQPAWQTRNIAVVDVTGDKLPDIIVANRDNPSRSANYICSNRGKGQFDDACLAFARYPSTTIAPADVNRDGLIDLVVPHRDGGQSYVYLNTGDGGFTDSRRVPFGPPEAHIRVAQAADFNGDGLLDIVAADERAGVAIYAGERNNGFAARKNLAGAKPVPYALTTADVDGNGAIDVIVGHVEAAPVIFFNEGRSGRFTPVPFGDAKGTAYGFATGDLDRDGLMDIGLARSDAPNMVYFGRRPRTR